jgi:hypothetical protein
MDAFRAVQPCLIEPMRENLAQTFPPREMRLHADRQRRLITVETLLLSPRFSTCNEQQVAAFMSVLADLSFDQMYEMEDLVAGRQIIPSSVDLAGHSPSSSVTDSTPRNPPFPRTNSHPAEDALMEGLLFDGPLDQDGRANAGLLSDAPLNPNGWVNAGGIASVDATHGSASVVVTAPSSTFSATEPSFGNLSLYDTHFE